MEDTYTLKRGSEGARRLEILGRAMWPSTLALFQRAGLSAGQRCVDVGCGVGLVTEEVARLTGHCLGLDNDSEFLNYAKAHRQTVGASFQEFDIVHGVAEEGRFDVAFSRYLLSHLGNPLEALQKIVSLVRPGGLILVEDIDFPGHFHHPPSRAFARYLELYQAAVERRGGNPRLGRELFGMATTLGLTEIDIHLVVAVHHTGPSKAVAQLTLEHIGDALVGQGLLEHSELASLLDELKAYVEDPKTQVSIAPTFQLMARKA